LDWIGLDWIGFHEDNQWVTNPLARYRFLISDSDFEMLSGGNTLVWLLQLIMILITKSSFA